MIPDPAAFRAAMGQYPTGVSVIATGDGDGIHAMTAGSLTSVSLDPPLILFCLSRRARMAALLAPDRRFSANVLRSDQRALSTWFAGSWKEPVPPPHRFVPWREVPRLEGVVVTLGCIVTTIAEAGDHLIVFGAVFDTHLGPGPREPLIFFDRRYHSIDSRSAEAAPELDAPAAQARLFHEPW